MSTLTSVDMNIERSSTRRHAPPGGKSSFSLSYDEPVAAAPKKQQQSSFSLNYDEPVAAAPKRQQPVAADIPKENQSFKAPTDQAPFRKVRQAPGGTSSLVIG